jgi:hypothetical protein
MCHISQWSSEIVYCISRVETSVKSNFQHVVYTIFFRRPQRKTLIFGIPSNFKYYLTELRTKHTLVAMVTTTVCNDFIAHRLEGI